MQDLMIDSDKKPMKGEVIMQTPAFTMPPRENIVMPTPKWAAGAGGQASGSRASRGRGREDSRSRSRARPARRGWGGSRDSRGREDSRPPWGDSRRGRGRSASRCRNSRISRGRSTSRCRIEPHQPREPPPKHQLRGHAEQEPIAQPRRAPTKEKVEPKGSAAQPRAAIGALTKQAYIEEKLDDDGEQHAKADEIEETTIDDNDEWRLEVQGIKMMMDEKKGELSAMRSRLSELGVQESAQAKPARGGRAEKAMRIIDLVHQNNLGELVDFCLTKEAGDDDDDDDDDGPQPRPGKQRQRQFGCQ
jgi:hypothetical protein